MTARRLYDRYCDAVSRCRSNEWDASQGRYVRKTLTAWPFLADSQKAVWREMARSMRERKNYA